jgi:uncharacterized protein YbjT (DUF2867 family)
VTSAVHRDQPTFEIDVGPLEVNQLVETHPGTDDERHDLTDALRALDQELRDLLARLDTRADRRVLLTDPGHAVTPFGLGPFAVDEVRERR